jgi:hypothetical protein
MLSTAQRDFIDRWRKDEKGIYKRETAKEYAYFMRIVGEDGNIEDSDIMGPMSPKSNWFNTQKTVVFAFVIMFLAISGFYIIQAKRARHISSVR